MVLLPMNRARCRRGSKEAQYSNAMGREGHGKSAILYMHLSNVLDLLFVRGLMLLGRSEIVHKILLESTMGLVDTS